MSRQITITDPSGATLKTKNKYMDDDVAVQVDGAENIVAGNIKNGVSILGVSGTYEGGGGDTGEPYIKFYDYDGELVVSWSEDELTNATSLPEGPDHTDDNLTFQNWNYTLAEIKSQNKPINVGAVFKTSDDITYLYIQPTMYNYSIEICFYNESGTLTIDWGDGGASSYSSTGYSSLSRQYGQYSKIYEIKISSTGTYRLGANNSGVVLNNIKNVIGYQTNHKYSLKKVKLANNVTQLMDYAFYNCYSLRTINIPNSVTIISNYAFGQCFSLASTIIPNTVSQIPNGVFGTNQINKLISIPNSVTSLGNSVFQNCYLLEPQTLPNSITSIGTSLFAGAHGQKNISWLSNCNTIATSMYSSNYGLESVIIPNNITAIGDNAFRYSSGLRYVKIPNSVTSIGDYAFNYIFGLEIVDLTECDTPPTIPRDARQVFGCDTSNVDNLAVIFYIKKGTLSNYRSITNWATVANLMVEVD